MLTAGPHLTEVSASWPLTFIVEHNVLDISAHFVGGCQRWMILDFAGCRHSACKYIAGEACPVETFNPAFKTRNCPGGNFGIVLGGAGQNVNIRELIVATKYCCYLEDSWI